MCFIRVLDCVLIYLSTIAIVLEVPIFNTSYYNSALILTPMLPYKFKVFPPYKYLFDLVDTLTDTVLVNL